MTFYMLYLKLQNSKCGVTVHMGKKIKFTFDGRGVTILDVRNMKKQEWASL